MRPSGPLRILLAEDNKINQKFAVAILAKAGHSVDVVENGLLAVDAVRRNVYDVILMDIQMPELDGIGATREIRALSQPKCAIPIIALTANAMAGDEKRYIEAGMDAYVSKPIQPAELFTKLAAVAKEVAGHLPTSATPLGSAGDVVKHPNEPSQKDNGLVILDLEKLATLEAALPTKSVLDLLRLFIIDTENHIGYIHERRVAGDIDGVARNAHVIISTAGNIGAAQVSALAQQLVRACHVNDCGEVAGLVEQLIAANAAASSAIQSWLKDITTEEVKSEHARERSIAG